MKNKLFYLCFLVGCLFLFSCTTFSQEADFERWKKDFEKQAIAEGVDPVFLKEVLPQMKLLDHVVASDKKQSEFRLTFWDYTNRTLSQARIQKGKEMMQEHAQLLAKTEQKYGVPAKYIVAFWGMETNYGRYKGNIEILDALTTLAYDQRRRAFFTRELIVFLKIMQQEEAFGIHGSWAGAFGNFQFMPTTFMAYAVDGDGDGKRDIVNSLPDAFASAANYLSHMGWDQNVRWGREVKLTKPLDWDVVYSNVPKTVKDWSKMGVIPADGSKWDQSSQTIVGELTMPMGVDGPIFLTYSNFKIIMRWNRSQLYALSVGLLADGIEGDSVRIYAPRKNLPFSLEQSKEIQEILTEKGYYKGEIDGTLGRGTRQAVRAYQKANGLPQDGYATEELLNKMKGL